MDKEILKQTLAACSAKITMLDKRTQKWQEDLWAAKDYVKKIQALAEEFETKISNYKYDLEGARFTIDEITALLEQVIEPEDVATALRATQKIQAVLARLSR